MQWEEFKMPLFVWVSISLKKNACIYVEFFVLALLIIILLD